MALYHPKYNITIKNIDRQHRKRWAIMGFIVIPDIELVK